MNSPLSTTSLARLSALLLAGFVFGLFVPAASDPGDTGFSYIIAIFTSMGLMLLLSEAVTRRQKLLETVRVELNKLRRIYHLSRNISESTASFRGWFTELHKYLYEYLLGFENKDFESYDSFNAKFRKLSFHIYTIPDFQSSKDGALYQDLLHTTATVADARQQIKELWDNRLSSFSWIAALFLGALFCFSISLSITDTITSRLAGGAAVSAMLVVLGLLWDADALTLEKRLLARRYVDNIARLELTRK